MFLCSCITFGSCFLDIMESGSVNMYRDGTGGKMAAALAPVQNHVLNVCYECCHQLLQAVVILGHFYYQKSDTILHNW